MQQHFGIKKSAEQGCKEAECKLNYLLNVNETIMNHGEGCKIRNILHIIIFNKCIIISTTIIHLNHL